MPLCVSITFCRCTTPGLFSAVLITLWTFGLRLPGDQHVYAVIGFTQDYGYCGKVNVSGNAVTGEWDGMFEVSHITVPDLCQLPSCATYCPACSTQEICHTLLLASLWLRLSPLRTLWCPPSDHLLLSCVPVDLRRDYGR